MGKDSAIEWCHSTFNPWRGCSKISCGCANCYAWLGAKRNPRLMGRWGPNGTRVVASEAKWREVLAWNRDAKAAGERQRVFCASVADVYEAWGGPMLDAQERVLHYNSAATWWTSEPTPHGPITMDFVAERLFDTIRATPSLDWLLVTKRPENWRKRWPLVPVPGHVRQNEGDGKTWERFPNLWQGVTVENRKEGLPRIDLLREIPAAVRFLSVEPLLEDLGELDLTGIDWVIVGGESGGDARPFDLAWARSIQRQCEAQGVAFFMKQVGAKPTGYWLDPLAPGDGICYSPGPGRDHWKLADSHGGDWSEWPADLRVREFPAAFEVGK